MVEESEARAIIEAIAEDRRRQVNDITRNLLKLVAKELYGRDFHFVLELIQNAEDNDYAPDQQERFVRFTLRDGRIIVQNNERGFTRPNIESLCSAGQSTKRQRTLGYVGEKGIGFKSVFKISARPQVFSNGFRFELDDENYIIPAWAEPPAGLDLAGLTTLVLPLRPDYLALGDRLWQQFAHLDARTLLFLRKLTRIELADPAGQRARVLRRMDAEDGRVSLDSGEGRSDWWLHRREVRVPVGLEEEKREGVARRELVIAFALTGERCRQLPDARVFAFLPTELRPGLPFLVQGDFLLTANREALLEDNRWNGWLRDEIGPTFVEAVRRGVAREAFARSYLACVPLPNDIHSAFFRPVAEHVVRALPRERVFPAESGRLRTAAEVLRAPAAFRKLFPNAELARLLGREVEYLHPDCAAADERGAVLGIRQLGAAELQRLLSNTTWLERQDDEWFIDLYGTLYDHADAFPGVDWTALPIVRLAGGRLVRTADGPVYLPAREERLDDIYGLHRFQWRLVAHAIVRRDPSPRTEFERAENERVRKAREFLLQKANVSQHRALEIAYKVVLPLLRKNLTTHTYASVNDLKDDFGLILYLKEQWADIEDAADQSGSAITRQALLAAARESVPVPATSAGNAPTVVAAGRAYVGPQLGGSAALQRLFGELPGVCFLADAFITWDPARRQADRKREEWLSFLRKIGVASTLRLERSTYSSLDVPSHLANAHLPADASNFSSQADRQAPDLVLLFAGWDARPLEWRLAKGRQLLRYLDETWEEFEREHRQGPGIPWYTTVYDFRTSSRGSVTSSRGPCTFWRQLLDMAWVPTQNGQAARPEEVWAHVDRDLEGASTGLLLAGKVGHPALATALKLREKATDAELVDLLRSWAHGKSRNPTACKHVYERLQAQLVEGRSPEYAAAFRHDRLIYLPSRAEPWSTAAEVVWRAPEDRDAAGFPALEPVYPELGRFFHAVGVVDQPTADQAIEVLRYAQGLERAADGDRQRIWEAYQVLAALHGGAIAAAEGEALREFRRQGQLLDRDGRFQPIDDLVLPDDDHLVRLFGTRLTYLWLPPAPMDTVRRLGQALRLTPVSRAAASWEREEGAASEELLDLLERSREPLVGYIRQQYPDRYLALQRGDALCTLAAGPLAPVRRLAVRYALSGKIVEDRNSQRVAILDGKCFVLVDSGEDIDLIGEGLERALSVPQLSLLFARLCTLDGARFAAFVDHKGYRVPESDWRALQEQYLERWAPKPVAKTPSLSASSAAMPGPAMRAGAAGPEPSRPRVATALPKPPTGSGVRFNGRTSLVPPKGSNDGLRQRLGERFPRLRDAGQRQEIERYLAGPEPDAPLAAAESTAAEAGAIPVRAKTVLRAVNLEECFLQFDQAALALLSLAGFPKEIELAGEDETLVAACVDYDHAILHAGPSATRKADFRALLEEAALVPGAVLALEPSHAARRFTLRPVRPDHPQMIRDVDWWDLDDRGLPITERTGEVAFDYQVDESVYRAERRWEQQAAYRAIVERRGVGILEAVYDLLRDDTVDQGGLPTTAIHRRLLREERPCSYQSVLAVLYGYDCFEHLVDGRWRLRIGGAKQERAAYQRANRGEGADVEGDAPAWIPVSPVSSPIVSDKIDSETGDASRSHVVHAAGDAHPSHPDNNMPVAAIPALVGSPSGSPGAPMVGVALLTEVHEWRLRGALDALRARDRTRWRDALLALQTLLNELLSALGSDAASAATDPSRPMDGAGAAERDTRTAVPKDALTALWRDAQAAGAPARLIAALIIWLGAQRGTPPQQALWALRLGEALEGVKAHRSALQCFDRAREQGSPLPDEYAIVRLAALALPEQRDMEIMREQLAKGQKWLAKSKHATSLSQMVHPQWLDRALSAMPGGASASRVLDRSGNGRHLERRGGNAAPVEVQGRWRLGKVR